ncbi:gliding motility-associated C-terminal domain-containing protein [Dyadobacter tibetensis]|uniref:gliding motility-associated C-terminal domain-containing protein n=1 Tax=Dyadobacter tibetensis TaxID=1211851 RepID=UPI00047010A8|nr:T9SS C-terminal target domain-containing protein [Dyadobacter tibetensis]
MNPAKGQNLVPNGGFENIIKKPCDLLTTIGDNVSVFSSNWYTPTGGTSDIWVDINTSNCAVDLLKRYNIKPHSGQFCGGIITSANNNEIINTNAIPVYREYLQVKLAQKLQTDKVYYLEFYAHFIYNSSLASNNLGALFTKDSIKSESPLDFGLLKYEPQINISEIISDTKNWVKVSGCFQASENYEFLTIGNFFPDSKTAFSPTIYLTGLEPYYLIDDVYLEEYDLNQLPPNDILGKDTTLCFGQTLNYDLSQYQQFDFYWPNNNHTPKYTIDRAGEYELNLAFNKCVVKDTIRVEIINEIDLGVDLNVCEDNFPIIIQSKNLESISWSNGETAKAITVSSAGTYSAQALDKQCYSEDSITIKSVTCPGLIPNVITPNNDGINDNFIIDNIRLIPWQLRIYNRWGKMVYQNKHYDNSWNGNNLSSGLYYYELSSQEISKHLKGWVNIIR